MRARHCAPPLLRLHAFAAPMNYRHAFHAGNFADVVKHAVLVRILVHLRAKPAAFRVIDTHAGAGLYDLAGAEASRSGEWREGIGRLLDRSPLGAAGARAACALSRCGRRLNGAGRLATYPGSPALVRAFLRAQDRLIACELEPNAAAALARNLARRPPQQGGRDRRLDRAQRLCAAEGAARARPHRSAVRGCRRFSAARAGARSRAPQMGERQLSAVVSDQGARGARCAGAAPAALRHGENPARRAQILRVDSHRRAAIRDPRSAPAA